MIRHDGGDGGERSPSPSPPPPSSSRAQEKSPDPESHRLLAEFGIDELVAVELARKHDPVTIRHVIAVSGERDLSCPQGWVIWCLRSGNIPCSRQAAAEQQAQAKERKERQNRRKYIGGPYAEYIEH